MILFHARHEYKQKVWVCLSKKLRALKNQKWVDEMTGAQLQSAAPRASSLLGLSWSRGSYASLFRLIWAYYYGSWSWLNYSQCLSLFGHLFGLIWDQIWGHNWADLGLIMHYYLGWSEVIIMGLSRLILGQVWLPFGFIWLVLALGFGLIWNQLWVIIGGDLRLV